MLPVTVYKLVKLTIQSFKAENIQCVSLRFVVQVSSEKGEEVVHLSLKELWAISHIRQSSIALGSYLLLFWVFDCVSKLIEGISHLARSYRRGGVFESLIIMIC